MSDFGIYIHWPFCRSKCPYCDFLSRVQPNIDQDKLIASYLEDLTFYAQKTGPRTVTSVFFGGGTPSLLNPRQIEKIIAAVDKNWGLSRNAEISLEANPNTTDKALFADFRAAGINRLSLGIQSLDNQELKFLGRTHSAAMALRALEEILKIFDNHSADLIYALPGQTLSNWQKTLKTILSFGLKHLSLYQLTIEEGTPFARKNISLPEEDFAADIFLTTEKLLEENGFQHYEVSNYAQKGYACRHNLLYWRGNDYVGVGEGAHGRLRIGNHFWATEHRRRMIELTPDERAQELLLMGLRLTSGIDKTLFEQTCSQNFDSFVNSDSLSELIKNGLLIDTPQNLRATPAGFLVLDKVTEELV